MQLSAETRGLAQKKQLAVCWACQISV